MCDFHKYFLKVFIVEYNRYRIRFSPRNISIQRAVLVKLAYTIKYRDLYKLLQPSLIACLDELVTKTNRALKSLNVLYIINK